MNGKGGGSVDVSSFVKVEKLESDAGRGRKVFDGGGVPPSGG